MVAWLMMIAVEDARLDLQRRGSNPKADQRNLPSIALLPLMAGPAVAVEAARLGICVFAHCFDPHNTGSGKASGNIGFDIELLVPSATGSEESLVGGIVPKEVFREIIGHFIRGAGNAGSDGAADVFPSSRSEEQPSELQALMSSSSDVF